MFCFSIEFAPSTHGYSRNKVVTVRYAGGFRPQNVVSISTMTTGPCGIGVSCALGATVRFQAGSLPLGSALLRTI